MLFFFEDLPDLPPFELCLFLKTSPTSPPFSYAFTFENLPHLPPPHPLSIMFFLLKTCPTSLPLSYVFFENLPHLPPFSIYLSMLNSEFVPRRRSLLEK